MNFNEQTCNQHLYAETGHSQNLRDFLMPSPYLKAHLLHVQLLWLNINVCEISYVSCIAATSSLSLLYNILLGEYIGRPIHYSVDQDFGCLYMYYTYFIYIFYGQCLAFMNVSHVLYMSLENVYL